MKKKLVLKPLTVSVVYLVFIISVLSLLFLTIKYSKEKENITYVSKAILDEYIPVVNSEEKLIKPYVGEEVTILNNYYDYSDPTKQNGSIIYYENTYFQNTGINYISDKKFDVVSVLEGEVIDIKQNDLLGTEITIKHSNNLVSIYSSINNVKVKKGSQVMSGEVIAESGTSSLLNENNNLHFELYLNGEVVNPENYYNKTLKDF